MPQTPTEGGSQSLRESLRGTSQLRAHAHEQQPCQRWEHFEPLGLPAPTSSSTDSPWQVEGWRNEEPKVGEGGLINLWSLLKLKGERVLRCFSSEVGSILLLELRE